MGNEESRKGKYQKKPILTAHLAGHAHDEDSKAKAPNIPLQPGIQGTPNGGGSHVVVLKDGMRTEHPKDAHWDEREPEELEALQLS